MLEHLIGLADVTAPNIFLLKICLTELNYGQTYKYIGADFVSERGGIGSH